MYVILRDADNQPSESCTYVDALDVGAFTDETAAKPVTAVQDCTAASVRVTPLDIFFFFFFLAIKTAILGQIVVFS